MTEVASAEHDPRRPFSFPREPQPTPPPDAVRVPALGEIAALTEQFFPLIQRKHPRAIRAAVRQLLATATTAPANPPMRLLRTASALALFTAERDGFEPQWQVRTKSIEHRDALTRRS